MASVNVETPFRVVNIGFNFDEIRNNERNQVGRHRNRFLEMIPKEILHPVSLYDNLKIYGNERALQIIG